MNLTLELFGVIQCSLTVRLETYNKNGLWWLLTMFLCRIICSLMEFSEDAAAEVVLQGGLRAIVNILSSYSSDRQVCKSCSFCS